MNPPPPAKSHCPQTWADFFKNHSSLVESAFLQRWGNLPWTPSDEDREAAAKLHMQLVSRVTTQRLGYLDGVEKTALDSVYENFEKTRTICDAYPLARHFEQIAWHILNTQVRPFTAKWHGESVRGGLRGLDATDEFRAELHVLQIKLRAFLDLLLEMRDAQRPPTGEDHSRSDEEAQIDAEMNRELRFGIPPLRGGISDPATVASINRAERTAIDARRLHYGLKTDQAHASGLALSGGGIRSATFALGVLVALAKRGLLPQFDFLSTVSGGGYLGSFLTTYLNTEEKEEIAPAIGLGTNELPFQRTSGEAEALRHIRHHSKHLATGGVLSRLPIIMAQLYGMMLNGLGMFLLIATSVLVEYHLRHADAIEPLRKMVHVLWLLKASGIAFAVWATVSLGLIRGGSGKQRIADKGLTFLAGIAGALIVWLGLGHLHRWDFLTMRLDLPHVSVLAILGAIPVAMSAISTLPGKVFVILKKLLGLASIIAAPLFFFGFYLVVWHWASHGPSVSWLQVFGHQVTWLEVITAALAVVELWFLNINFTSPHRHYRNKLAEAYLIQPAKNPTSDQPFDIHDSLKLSAVRPDRGPYPLVNAALNVPSSKNPAMQGRLTDFFLFSPAFCGSPLTSYQPTKQWEKMDGHLDLGTATAISGAAVAPQMGLGTKRRISFWLALLNIRLGYWARKPDDGWRIFGNAPGLKYLIKEMRGTMDETEPWLFLSDGGHIENLAIYELLRRRCKFIVAVDGEEDKGMTFAGLTTLQRLAKIDMGIEIDINLDDMRLDEKGFSRSHFRFCRVTYPEKTTGYLLYTKLSLTGNEGEFLRRYRLDEPAFPHQSTLDQVFSEAQFEAYRSLGEHIGDKLFLRALIGTKLEEAHSLSLNTWFSELGKRLLEPKPDV